MSEMSEFCPPAPGTCATEPAEAFVFRAAVVLSLFLGGAGGLVVVEDHNVGGKICSAFSQKREHLFRSGKRCCMPGTSHLTVNPYIFVSTIPKILTEFSFGIGMVNTEKYRPIPTEKYQLGKQL